MTRLILVVLFMVIATSAMAQDCTIAPYGDRNGTASLVQPIEGRIFSIYVVIRADATVAAAAYQMTYPQGPSGMWLQGRFTGPSGNGLAIDEPTGTNAALAECVVGFGGDPILVDEYLFVTFPGFVGGVVSVGPNASQSPYSPRFVTCNDVTLDCAPGPDLIFEWVIPTDARSFSAIKSLYH